MRYPLLNASRRIFDPATVLALAAMTETPSVAQQVRYDSLIRTLKAAAVWDSLDCLYLFAAHTSQAALVNLKAPGTFNATLVGTASPTFTADRGFDTDGVDNYISSNFNPSTAGGLFIRNTASFGLWSLTDAQTASPLGGWFDGTDGVTLTARNANDAIGFRINHAAETTTANSSNTSGLGWYVANRSGSSSTSIFRNGVAVTESGNPDPASTVVNSNNLYAGRSATATFVAARFAAMFIGNSMNVSQSLAFYNAMLGYMQGVGLL